MWSAVKYLHSQLWRVFYRKLPLSIRSGWLYSETLSFKDVSVLHLQPEVHFKVDFNKKRISRLLTYEPAL